MYAIFFKNDIVTGWRDIPVTEQEQTEWLESGLDFFLVETIPSTLTDPPENHCVIIDRTTKEVVAVPLPPQPMSTTERIAELESENAILMLELAQTQIRLDQAEQEQAGLLLQLVERGVI